MDCPSLARRSSGLPYSAEIANTLAALTMACPAVPRSCNTHFLHRVYRQTLECCRTLEINCQISWLSSCRQVMWMIGCHGNQVYDQAWHFDPSLPVSELRYPIDLDSGSIIKKRLKHCSCRFCVSNLGPLSRGDPSRCHSACIRPIYPLSPANLIRSEA